MSTTEIRAIAPTCLHIGGVQGAIEDEAKLTQLFSKFGIVLAVTLRIRREGKKVSWALVSFSTVSEADSCLAGIGELAKEHPGLVARQVDENQVRRPAALSSKRGCLQMNANLRCCCGYRHYYPKGP